MRTSGMKVEGKREEENENMAEPKIMEEQPELHFDQDNGLEIMNVDEAEVSKESESCDSSLSEGSSGNSLLSEGEHMSGQTKTWGSTAFQKLLNLRSEVPLEVIIAMLGIMPGVPRSVMSSVNGIVAYCRGISALSWRRVEYAIRSVGYSHMQKIKICGCGRSLPCPDYKCNPSKTRPLYVLPLAEQLKSILSTAPSELLVPRDLGNRKYPAWIEFINVVEQSERVHAVMIHITVRTYQSSLFYFHILIIGSLVFNSA